MFNLKSLLEVENLLATNLLIKCWYQWVPILIEKEAWAVERY